MNSKLRKVVPFFCAGMVVYAGCTKEQSVRVDPAIAPSMTATATTVPATSETPAAAGKQQPASASGAATSTAGASAPEQSAAQSAAQGAAARGSVAATGGVEAKVGKELEKIYFDFDSALLSDAARRTLAENFEVLKGTAAAKLRIEGHCDERGSDEYNLALSERRARAAVNYLTSLGIDAERLTAVGYGEEKPADPAHTAEAWDKNRRDEFNIIK